LSDKTISDELSEIVAELLCHFDKQGSRKERHSVGPIGEKASLIENPRVKPKELKPEGINFGAVARLCCMAAYVYLNVKYRNSLPFFRGGNLNSPTPFFFMAGLIVIGASYVWWANKRDSHKLEMEEIRGTILKSCAGMRTLLADLNHPDAESFYRRLHVLELATETAKTEGQLAAAKLSFGVVWDALRSTPAGDGDAVLNGARCEKYLIKALPF
jgi:hypothetical protein